MMLIKFICNSLERLALSLYRSNIDISGWGMTTVEAISGFAQSSRIIKTLIIEFSIVMSLGSRLSDVIRTAVRNSRTNGIPRVEE